MTERPNKRCPFCGEQIHAEAVKCRFCREFLQDDKGLPISYHAQAAHRAPATPRDWLSRQRDPATPAAIGPRPTPAEQAEKEVESVFIVTPSLWALMGTFVKAICAAVVAGVLMFYPIGALLIDHAKLAEDIAGQVDYFTGLAGLAVLLIALVGICWRGLELKRIRYEICPDRVEYARGIFSRHIDNLDIFRIIDIKLHRSLLDCVTGVGSVTLITRDETDPVFHFEKVKDPKTLYDILKKASLIADRKQGVVHLQ